MYRKLEIFRSEIFCVMNNEFSSRKIFGCSLIYYIVYSTKYLMYTIFRVNNFRMCVANSFNAELW